MSCCRSVADIQTRLLSLSVINREYRYWDERRWNGIQIRLSGNREDNSLQAFLERPSGHFPWMVLESQPALKENYSIIYFMPRAPAIINIFPWPLMQGLVVCAMGTLMLTIYQHYAGGNLCLTIIYPVTEEKKERNLLLKKNIYLPLT